MAASKQGMGNACDGAHGGGCFQLLHMADDTQYCCHGVLHIKHMDNDTRQEIWMVGKSIIDVVRLATNNQGRRTALVRDDTNTTNSDISYEKSRAFN